MGDSNQRTTGGLMAWRKTDNWTAFTVLALFAGQAYGVQIALDSAASEVRNNPNVITERYGCAS